VNRLEKIAARVAQIVGTPGDPPPAKPAAEDPDVVKQGAVTYSVRIMDVDNGGMEWGESTVDVQLPEDDSVFAVAEAISRAQFISVAGPMEDDEISPGEVVQAAGSTDHGIAWIDDSGHQGATSIIIEWHIK
jgi:hypothetical protein